MEVKTKSFVNILEILDLVNSLSIIFKSILTNIDLE